ncbi:unnamed protein product [Nesidiocoris tenuis]|uniref:Uncharacterized protein n=1 Tax=Nesidiocoris tenuis TaxID=355587 RepID=A0A6H5H4P2_9HEMI|nr:unnamed protein product [Nesidiocoris tenuis]
MFRLTLSERRQRTIRKIPCGRLGSRDGLQPTDRPSAPGQFPRQSQRSSALPQLPAHAPHSKVDKFQQAEREATSRQSDFGHRLFSALQSSSGRHESWNRLALSSRTGPSSVQPYVHYPPRQGITQGTMCTYLLPMEKASLQASASSSALHSSWSCSSSALLLFLFLLFY